MIMLENDSLRQQYRQWLLAGPFPETSDPWAESGRYFHQMHADMISGIIEQIRDPLLDLGYYTTRETSLQIAEGKQPDIGILESQSVMPPRSTFNYATAAEALHAEPGILAEWQIIDLETIYIRQMETSQLVTVVEVVSPRNKTEIAMIDDYRERRERLVRWNGVNVVEIDLTRSVKRLLHSKLVNASAYHVAIYIPDDAPRLISMPLHEAFKRVALPLRGQVIAIDLQPVYVQAYQRNSISLQIMNDQAYKLADIPFPSLLTAAERQLCLDAVSRWQIELARLRPRES